MRKAANATAAAASHTSTVGFEALHPSTHTDTRLANGRARERPPPVSERVSSSPPETRPARRQPPHGAPLDPGFDVLLEVVQARDPPLDPSARQTCGRARYTSPREFATFG